MGTPQVGLAAVEGPARPPVDTHVEVTFAGIRRLERARLGALLLDVRDGAALLAVSFAASFVLIFSGLAILQTVASLLPR